MTAAGPGSAGSDFSFVNYHSPGVYSEAVGGPLYSVYNTTPVSVGLFGKTRGYQVANESLMIPPDGGGTVSTLTAPVVPGATVIYTANAFTDGTSVRIDTGDVSESPRTVTNVSAINTTMTAASVIADAVIKTVAPIGIGSTVTIDSGVNTETRTVTNATGLASTLSIAVPNGATTVYSPISFAQGTNLVLDSSGNLENRAVTSVSGGSSTTLTVACSIGAATISTAVLPVVGALLQIDTSTLMERHVVTAAVSGINTTASAATLANATSISTVLPISVGASIIIDTAGNQETRVVSAVTGTGPYTLTVPSMTYAHASGAVVVTPNTVTLDTGLTSAHAAGATISTLYAHVVAPLAYAHIAGTTVVAPQVGPYTISVSALAKAHASSTPVVCPTGLAVNSPMTYAHFIGAAVIGAGTVPAPSAQLAQTGVDTTSLVVRDPVTGLVYTLTTDYTAQSITGPSGVYQGSDAHYTITRQVNGNIPANKIIQAAYRYTDANYFTAKQFFTYNDLTDAYGPALDANGNIVSELSFAAGFAFLNGAARIVAAACTNPPSSAAQNYQNALDQLKNDVTIGVVCCASGSQLLHNMIKIHVGQQSRIKNERRAIVGVDGSVTPQPSATRIANAINIYDSRVAMVSPATIAWYNPILNTTQVIGGHFMACALAGLAVSLNPAMPLTRKTINGFVGVNEKYSETQKDVETQGGLLVLEQSNQGNVRIRHGVTTNFTSLLSREWTILGQQDTMVQALRNFLDNDGIIGQIIDDLTLWNVRASTINALEALSNSMIILGYRNVAVRQLQSNPDVVEVSFEWRPAIPLNYILLRFAINIQSIGIDASGAFTGPLDRSITGPL